MATASRNAQEMMDQAFALQKAGKANDAVAQYRRVLDLDPANARAWMNMGALLRKLGHHNASAVATLRALALNPDDAGVLTNLGNVLVDLGRVEDALAVHERAYALKPQDYLSRRNYAITLREACRYEEAYALFTALIEERPDDAALKFEQALTLLNLGALPQGWDAFEIRWQIPPMKPRVTPRPYWRGQDVAGKTVLVYEEQGFGDTLICSRFLPLLVARGARVILECKKPLHRLLSAIKGVELAEPNTVAQGYDYHVAMMSLPGAFKTTLDNIPPPPPLFVPDRAPPAVQGALDAGRGRLKVGIVWSGSVTFKNNHRRAVGPDRFLPLAAVSGVELYSLQKGPREDEHLAIGGGAVIHDVGRHMNDFAETASVLRQLDLVIMTDSSVAHLAASLGVPVWNLLNFSPYWLYPHGRDTTPWYDAMRLFRQPSPGDWDSVFAAVAQELGALAQARAQQAS